MCEEKYGWAGIDKVRSLVSKDSTGSLVLCTLYQKIYDSLHSTKGRLYRHEIRKPKFLAEFSLFGISVQASV